MEKFKIVADSSADTFEIDAIPFAFAPLKIITTEEEFTDTPELDVKGMVDFLQGYKGKSSTSCPNPEDWLSAFGDSENIFCVCITATLSGSYNAALAAKELYLETHPDRNVYVINSLSAGPELRLIIEKLAEYISDGLSFDEICQKIDQYMQSTGLLFMLESMRNLANNGRVGSLAAKAAGLLGIRVVGKASDKGDLEQLSKCRGQEKAVKFIADYIQQEGCKNGKIRISNCFNTEAAEQLKALLITKIPNADIEIYNAGALCSFYAEKGGMLIGFEKF
ncbi:MAG: DegV family EDD domain-containing protein [Ruminococcaceae bacterium]|nr:DegV family EDD domain-containing protein [Oscillospiraceae bacterium]